MSNLSNIGFPVNTEHDVNKVIMDILQHLKQMPCPPHGFYFQFEDDSGAEIYLQTNGAQEIIGFNPAFSGETRRRASISDAIERDTSPLDGAYKCWANPDGKGGGEYPFVFDSPVFRLNGDFEESSEIDINLTAFASNDFRHFGSPSEFREDSGKGVDVSLKSFIPNGLFTISEEGKPVEQSPPQAHVILTGVITEWQKRTNAFTGREFYYFVVETLGGFVDVVADPELIKTEPAIGGIIKGSFWLSGKIV